MNNNKLLNHLQKLSIKVYNYTNLGIKIIINCIILINFITFT